MAAGSYLSAHFPSSSVCNLGMQWSIAQALGILHPYRRFGESFWPPGLGLAQLPVNEWIEDLALSLSLLSVDLPFK